MDRSLQSLSRVLCIVGWLSAAAWASAAEVRVKVEGLRGEMEEAARASLTLAQPDSEATPAQIRRRFSDGKEEIRRSLEPFGYYNARVEGELRADKKDFEATYRVVTGDQVIVRKSNVRVLGDAGKHPGVIRAVKRFVPKVGQPFDHAVYEQGKAGIEAALANRGYARAQTTERRVEVSRVANSADIDLAWESGPRMRFGPVGFSEAQFSQELLQRFVPWKPNAYYSPNQLLIFQQRMIDADYFSTVLVQPNLSNTESTDVPVDVTLSPAKRSVYTATAYISTDTGVGARLATTRRWVNTSGHKADISIDSAQRLQAYGTTYRIPLFGQNDLSYNFGATYRDENTATSVSRNTRVTANQARAWRGYTRTLGLQYLAGNFEIADEQNYSTLLYAEATLSKKHANDYFFPRRGYSLVYGARFSPEGLVSDTSFTQVTLDAKWIRGFRKTQRVLLRGSAGAMAVDDFDQLPPELRFFAGGDRSIRGFDYEELGTRNADGQVIGGQYLAVGSAEYERYFLPNWGGAVFVDAGDAFTRSEFTVNVGAGFGLRWRSPVGILRVDIAKPVVSPISSNIRFHITIGPDL